MSATDVWLEIQSDYRRYRATGEKGVLQIVFLSQGFWACLIYRLSHSVHQGNTFPLIRKLLRIVTIIARKMIEILTGISLPAGCRIGRGLYIGHFGQIIVHPATQIGENCNLSQGVTIGLKARGRYSGVPTIGNRVFIGPNAVILGAVTIGNDAVIGPGAIVTKPIPPLAVVAGNPAVIISYRGSFEYIQFDDMDKDPQRLAALERQRKTCRDKSADD